MTIEQAPTFEGLASAIGIDLPPLLRTLQDRGRTAYGLAQHETWRERYLHNPPALISCYDFEWITANQSQEATVDWLNPEFQLGRCFLPFAQSGAGDSYCLTFTNTREIGVALVWHDDDESSIECRGFSDFVCMQFLTAFSDLSHLLKQGFSEQEAMQIVRADVHSVAGCMEPEARSYLLAFLKTEPAYRQYVDGPRSSARPAYSLISQECLVTERRNFSRPEMATFKVVAPWEVPVVRSIPDIITWRSLALHPHLKVQAIRAYQAEHRVTLAIAKLEVERYAITHSTTILFEASRAGERGVS